MAKYLVSKVKEYLKDHTVWHLLLNGSNAFQSSIDLFSRSLHVILHNIHTFHMVLIVGRSDWLEPGIHQVVYEIIFVPISSSRAWRPSRIVLSHVSYLKGLVQVLCATFGMKGIKVNTDNDVGIEGQKGRQ